jgi:hypothetical protein
LSRALCHAQGRGLAAAATAEEMKLAEHLQRVYQASGRRDAAALRGMRYYQANPEAKPFSHPYHWVPFVFYGC